MLPTLSYNKEEMGPAKIRGFSTLFKLNVWDLNPSIKWDQLLDNL
jgi:hypothetical protein